jgi:nucleoside-diphosphate kinase
MDKEKKITIAEFPASAPSNKEEAESQIYLMWEKYKHKGGPLKDSIVYPEEDKKKVENSLALVKPNAFEDTYDPRIGDVINTISMTGLYIIGVKIQIPTKEQMEEFYIVHKDKPFFKDLIEFMSGKKSLALLYEGINARKELREAALRVIRHAYSDSILENTVHTSDTREDFIREFKVINFYDNRLP